MSEAHPEPNYMAVFYSLTVLTVLEVGAAYLNIIFEGFPLIILASILIVLAVAKAALVAMYFMHLKFEKRTLGVIALTPLILCTLLIFSLLPDLTGSNREAKSEAKTQQQNVEQVANANEPVNEEQAAVE